MQLARLGGFAAEWWWGAGCCTGGFGLFGSFDLGFGSWNGQWNGIVVFFLKILSDGAEIDDEEVFLLVFRIADSESKAARAAAFDLNVLRGREDGPHQDDIQQILAVVARGEHIHGDSDFFDAFPVAKIFRDAGSVRDARSDGDSEIRL